MRKVLRSDDGETDVLETAKKFSIRLDGVSKSFEIEPNEWKYI